MTPERALEVWRNVEGIKHSSLDDDVVTAILAACAEERRDALTEAAEVCRAKIDAEYKTGKVDHHEMAWCQSCEFAILALRDKGDE